MYYNQYKFVELTLKYVFRPFFALMLLLISPKFSAISPSGSLFLIFPGSPVSNVRLYNS